MANEMDVLLKMKPEVISRHINDFIAEARKQNRNDRRFLARGAYLRALGDALNTRLQKGWDYLAKNPDDLEASDLWFNLLTQYEQINNTLTEYKPDGDMDSAAKSMFNAVEVPNESGRPGG